MNIRLHLSFVIFHFSFFFILFSCQKDPTALDNAQLELKAEYVEVTEAWLRLTTDTISKYSTYVVKRDTHLVFKGTMQKPDTLLHDENLEPLHTYTYTAYRLVDNQPPATRSRKQVTITTMDTTTHNFSWHVFEFGAHSSSAFYDVAIISPTDIWCAGEIYTEDSYTYDSLGNWIMPYNAAHWDGERWELKRIIRGNAYGSKNAVYAFNKNEIWFGGSIPVFYNGSNNFWYAPDNESGNPKGYTGGWRINKIWGTSSSNLYVVGNGGNIRHFNGSFWKEIKTGIDVPINDIFSTDNEKIYLPASYLILFQGFSRDRKLLCIKAGQVVDENWPYKDRKIASIWIDEKDCLYSCGGGIFKKQPNGRWLDYKIEPAFLTTRIRGNASNDFYVVGHFGFLKHFNGKTWRSYTQFDEIDMFNSIDVKDETVVAVGSDNNKAVIYQRK